MPQPTDPSPNARIAAQLYPENARQDEDVDAGGEDSEGDEQGDENVPTVSNFDRVFKEIGDRSKDADHGRAAMSGNGGLVATNLAIKPGQKGYFGSLCAMRWSHAMTKNGNSMDPEIIMSSGARSTRDKSGNRYIYGVEDAEKYLDEAYGNGVDVTNDLDAIQGKKGFLVIKKPQVMTNRDKTPIYGHITAWDGQKTADDSQKFMNNAKHIYFYEVQDRRSD